MQHPFGMADVFSDPDIHGGQPVVESGVPIYLILDMLAQRFPPDEMRQNYGITDEHVRFAAELVRREGHDAAYPPSRVIE